MFQNRVPHILEGDYTPLSSVNIFVRIWASCSTRRASWPSAAAGRRGAASSIATAAAGHGNEDDAAVVEFPRRAGIELPQQKA